MGPASRPGCRPPRRRKTATDLPQALFGAWDWTNYQTSLGAMLTVCVFTVAAGMIMPDSPVQGSPVWEPTRSIGGVSASSSASAAREPRSAHTQQPDGSAVRGSYVLGFVRCTFASLICSTHGELALLLGTMLISLVDVERVLGSIKLREAIITLGLQRIALHAVVNLVLGNWVWSMAPSAAWMAITAVMIRRCLVPPRRSFRLAGLPLSEQSIGEVVCLQLCLVSPDPWCWLASAVLAFCACSPWISPIHLRSRFFPKLWVDDVQDAGATVLARFHPVARHDAADARDDA